MKKSPTIRKYFVDESGDATIFNSRGHVLIGEQGCSRYFILGVLDIANPASLLQELNELRSSLLADPYFKGVPSMQPAARTSSVITVVPQTSQESGGLQAVDYFLWSLQRFYERKEDRYLNLLWPSFRLVHDLDDTRVNDYGVYYTQKRPLTLAALENNSPGI